MLRSLKHNLALKLDLIGFSASTICAIHCFTMPFIIVFLPLLGIQFIANPVFEYCFISLSLFIGAYTFKHGYFNHHKKIYPFAIFFLGFSIILIGHFLFHQHSYDQNLTELEKHTDEFLFLMIAPIGASIIAFSHLLNRSLTRNFKSSCNDIS